MKKRLVVIWQTLECPLAFGDFVVFLAICNCTSHQMGFGGLFKLVIIQNGYRKVGVEANYDESHQERKFRNVIVNTAVMCNWVSDIEIIRSGMLKIREGDIILPSKETMEKRAPGVPEWMITPMTARQLESCYKHGLKNTPFGFSGATDKISFYSKKFKERALVLQLRQIIPSMKKFSRKRNL